jgi:prophage antirepressor-like protein
MMLTANCSSGNHQGFRQWIHDTVVKHVNEHGYPKEKTKPAVHRNTEATFGRKLEA